MISVALLLSLGLGLVDEQWQRSQLYLHLKSFSQPGPHTSCEIDQKSFWRL